MSSVVSCLFLSCALTLKLHSSDCDFDSHQLFIVSPSPFLSLYIHIHTYILITNVHETYVFESIFPGTKKTGTGPSSG